MNPFDILKNAGKIKEQMKDWGARQAQIEAEGVSGAGLVRVVMGGDFTARKITIDPGVFSDPEKQPLLEPLLISAVNEAIRNVKEKTRQELSSLMGFPMPEGGLGF